MPREQYCGVTLVKLSTRKHKHRDGFGHDVLVNDGGNYTGYLFAYYLGGENGSDMEHILDPYEIGA